MPLPSQSASDRVLSFTDIPGYSPAENLALCFQEVFTVIVRLQSNRHPVSDAEDFRRRMRHLLNMCEQRSRKLGYSGEDTKMATFALVAFLDETVLNLNDPVFARWHKRPLQEEMFGVHVAGKLFFQGVDRLVARDDSAHLADLLEVYYLCLLLGYSGQYNLGQDQKMSELNFYCNKVSGKIEQIRRALYDSAPPAPEEAIRLTARDPWVRRMAVTAVLCVGFALVFYILYWSFLSSGVSRLNGLVGSVGLALPSISMAAFAASPHPGAGAGLQESGVRSRESGSRFRVPDCQLPTANCQPGS